MYIKYQLLLFLFCNCAAFLYGVVARARYLHNGDLYCITAIQGSDACCFDGFVNIDESGVKSESGKCVVNSRLSEFRTCVGYVLGRTYYHATSVVAKLQIHGIPARSVTAKIDNPHFRQ